MFNTEFYKCCGINIISDFGYDGQRMFRFFDDPPLEEIEEYLEQVDYKCRGLTLIALNKSQQKVLEKIVLKHGFKPLVEDFFHPGHDSRITLYGRVNWTEDMITARKKETEELVSGLAAQEAREFLRSTSRQTASTQAPFTAPVSTTLRVRNRTASSARRSYPSF